MKFVTILAGIAATQAFVFEIKNNVENIPELPRVCRRELSRVKKNLFEELIDAKAECPVGSYGMGDICVSAQCPKDLSFECGLLCTESQETCTATWNLYCFFI